MRQAGCCAGGHQTPSRRTRARKRRIRPSWRQVPRRARPRRAPRLDRVATAPPSSSSRRHEGRRHGRRKTSSTSSAPGRKHEDRALYAALSAAAVEQRLVHHGQHYDAAVSDGSCRGCRFRSPRELEVRWEPGAQTARALDGLGGSSSRSSPTSWSCPRVNRRWPPPCGCEAAIPVCPSSGLRSFAGRLPRSTTAPSRIRLDVLLTTAEAMVTGRRPTNRPSGSRSSGTR